jgi:MFS family permease
MPSPSVDSPGRSHSPGTDPRARNIRVLTTLLLASTLTVMAGAIVAPSLPLIRDHFGQGPRVELLVRLVLTMPALFIVMGAPLAGWFADRRGRKGLLAWSMVLYAVAGSAGAFLPSLEGILVSRALLGLAVAGVMTAVTALLADYFDGEERARVLGIQAAFMGMGGVVFTTLGGVLAGVDWRGPFLVYLLALGALPAVLALLWEPLRGEGPRGTPSRSDSPPLRARLPMDVVLPVYLVGFLLQLAFYTIPVQIPFRLAELSGQGPLLAGLAIGTTSLFFSGASLVAARFNQGLAPGSVILRGFLVSALGFTGIALAGGGGTLFPALAVSGAGFGLVLPAMGVWLTREVPVSLRGRALGGYTTALFLGQFVSPLATQPILRAWGSGGMYGVTAAVLALVAISIRLSLGRGEGAAA